MVKLGHVALDGAKVRANASRHKAMSYRRMKEQEAQLSAEVAELLRRAQEWMTRRIVGTVGTSAEMSCRRSCPFGKDDWGRYGRPKAVLKAEAEAEGKAYPGVPDDKAQRNFTDAESRIMPAAGPVGTSCKPTTVRRWWTMPTR